MKKILGFSLAEALITLLIVCLITLASVPILTKKKRDLSNLEHGVWACTLNSQGQYVQWTKQDSKGDMDNPDTWSLTNHNYCDFVPTAKARNFAITVIGGGGGGAEGVSEIKRYIDENTSAFSPSETDYYNIFVSGGGGGGAGGQEQSDQPGGGGGSGAFSFGTIKLFKNTTYSGTSGGGGAPVCSQWKEHTSSGESGGVSVFRAGADELIKASGGEGGQNRNCQKSSCYGGGPGAGGVLSYSSSISAYDNNLSGGGGAAGSNEWGGAGAKLDKVFYGGNSDMVFGAGGNGAKQNKCGGSAGSAGTVKVWQIKQTAGNGGGAATANPIFYPSLKGKLRATVGAGGGSGSSGSMSQISLYNSKNAVTQTRNGSGGSPGTIGATKTPTRGNDSLYNDKGGGDVGSCQPAKPARTEYETKYREIPTGNCLYEINICPAPAVRLPNGSWPANTMLCKYSQTSLRGSCVNAQFLDDMEILHTSKNENFFQEQTISSLVSLTRSYYINACQVDMTTNENAVCLREERLKTTYQVPIWKSAEPAKCDDSMPGRFFGAGGGGGPTGDSVGISGKGGAGAPGAVFIEW